MPQRLLAVFAVEQITHRLPARFVGLGDGLALVGVHPLAAIAVCRFFRSAALRTAIGETGLVGLQFKFFIADDTNFDRKCHTFL